MDNNLEVGFEIPGEASGSSLEPGRDVGSTQVSPEEEKALASGWRPLEEWDGNPEDWIDAKTFNKNGEYIDHIQSLSSNYKKAQKKIAKLEKEFSVLADHHAKVRELEYKKALGDLKNLKKEALLNLDADKVLEIDDQIEELRESQAQEQKASAAETSEVGDYVKSWVSQNKWYETDKTLRAATNGLIQEILAEDPSRKEDIEGVLSDVLVQLKQDFPNKFGNATPRTRSTSATIEPDNDVRTTKTNYSRRLTAEERKFAQRFVEAGAFKSVEEYAKQLYELEQVG